MAFPVQGLLDVHHVELGLVVVRTLVVVRERTRVLQASSAFHKVNLNYLQIKLIISNISVLLK